MAREKVGALRMAVLLLHNIGSVQVRWEGTVLGWDMAPCAMHEGGVAPNTLRPKSTVDKAVPLFLERSAEVQT